MIPGLTAWFKPVQDITLGARVSRTAYQYTLLDTDAAELAAWTPKLVERLAALPQFAGVTSDQQNEGAQLQVTVDRQAAMRLGVTMQAIEDTLYDAFGQRQVSTIFAQANQYRVILESDQNWQGDPSTLRLLRVPGTNDAQVPLAAVATIRRVTGAAGGDA